jgi:hypothetical protein
MKKDNRETEKQPQDFERHGTRDFKAPARAAAIGRKA